MKSIWSVTKTKLLCGLLCCSALAGAQQDSEALPGRLGQPVALLEGWEFAQAGTGEWRSAQVPGTVHQDLRRHGLLPDPFYGRNEQRIQWVENEDWEYRTTFQVSAEQLQHDGAQLCFEGLDTYADVYLNGALLLRADNMFVGYTVPVREFLREGENRLQVYFHSPIRQTLPQQASNGFNYPADNDHHAQHLSVFTRKAPYSYGWDWGIRMVTSGIWRPVSLCFFEAAQVTDYFVRQQELTDSRACLNNELEIENVRSQPLEVEVQVAVSLEGREVAMVKRSEVLQPGRNRIALPVEVNNPQRWMPNGWGKPTLYDFQATVYTDGHRVAGKSHRIGLRTVRVVNEPDAHGESFYLEVNGVPLFAKGANYIPQDALLPAVSAERYERLFRDVKEANMNLLRVWGGGVYEDDRFYDLADAHGILIWQDFMFACTPYPSDPTFLRRVSEEADYNLRRLRNHPSLALWCGNNEILEALQYWGYQKKFSKTVYEGFWKGYDKLFRELLPAKVKEWDADRFYVHSSPYRANWGRPESWGTGDSHNWGVWYGQKPFESLDTDIPRFMSEFGFQSFPEMKTIATFAAPADYQIESEVMNAHQKSSIGNHLIRTYMERDYIVPQAFDDFVYVGLVLQGQGMRRGLEAHRRHRPYCMGSLYWQLNDSWPVVSWSSIDYYGNWKALHYQAQRAFAPLHLNPLQQADSLSVYLLHDGLQTRRGLTLEMQVRSFSGRRVGAPVVLKQQDVEANASVCLYRTSLAALLAEVAGAATKAEVAGAAAQHFWQLTLKDERGRVLEEAVHFFAKPKDLQLPATTIRCKAKWTDGRCELTLSSPVLAKDVFIETPWQGARLTDNFFDLLPGEKKKVVVTAPLIRAADARTCRVVNAGETAAGHGQVIRLRHLQQTYLSDK